MIYTVHRKINYTLDDKEHSLRIKAKMTIGVINKTKMELEREGIKKTVPQLIDAVSELDIDVIHLLLVNSIEYATDLYADEFMPFIELNDALELIVELLNISIQPKGQKVKKISIFEDEEEEDETLDWDFIHMEYIWTHYLKRTDNMNNVTPKEFFEQLDKHQKTIQEQQNEIVEEA